MTQGRTRYDVGVVCFFVEASFSRLPGRIKNFAFITNRPPEFGQTCKQARGQKTRPKVNVESPSHIQLGPKPDHYVLDGALEVPSNQDFLA